MIGTWLDGKPLYKKAIVYDIPQNGSYSIPVNIQGTYHIVNWRGNFFQFGYENPNFIMHVPYTYINQANTSEIINIYCYYNPSRQEFAIDLYGTGQYASGYFNGQVVMYIEYTKT